RSVTLLQRRAEGEGPCTSSDSVQVANSSVFVGLDLRLPKGDPGAGGEGEDASPPGRAFPRLEYHRRPERTSPLDHIYEVGDLDVRQPQGALAVVFDDGALARV